MTDQEYKIKVAEDLGSIKTMCLHMIETLNKYKDDQDRHNGAIWKKLDNHAEKISKHSRLLGWILGVGSTLSVLFSGLIGFFKR